MSDDMHQNLASSFQSPLFSTPVGTASVPVCILQSLLSTYCVLGDILL